MPDPAFASDPLDFDIAIEPIAPPPIASPAPAAVAEPTAAEREAVRLEVVRDAEDPLNEADPFSVPMPADAPTDPGAPLDLDLPSAAAAADGAAAGWADVPDDDAAADVPVAASAAPAGLFGRVLAMVPGLGAWSLGRNLRLPAGGSAGTAAGALRGRNLETLRTVGMVAALVLVALFAGRTWSASSSGPIDQVLLEQLSEEVAALTVRLDAMDLRAAQAAAAADAHAAPSLPATAYSFQPPDPAPKKAEVSDSPWQKFNLGATSTVSGGTGSVTPTPTPASTSGNRGTLPDGRPLYTNGQNVYNCSDFKTWEDAQAVLEANRPGDPNILDIAGRGVACPALKPK